MKSYLPLLALALFVTSCTAYKTGQTPDDVYYSKSRPVDEYVRVEKKEKQQYQDPAQYRENEYLRMNIYDRRWSSVLDDQYYNSYTYNPYGTYYNNYLSYNSPWNYYNYWNYHYNPYCGYYSNGGGFSKYYTAYTVNAPVYNKPRTTNLFVFDTQGSNSNSSSKTYRGGSNFNNGNNTNNYRNSGTNAGNFLRNTFSDNSSNNNTSRSSSTSSTPSSSSGSSSSGSSSSSSSAPVRKF